MFAYSIIQQVSRLKREVDARERDARLGFENLKAGLEAENRALAEQIVNLKVRQWILFYYYSINQIDMCRISLNQILRNESQENHF
jgi:hypothetical protein